MLGTLLSPRDGAVNKTDMVPARLGLRSSVMGEWEVGGCGPQVGGTWACEGQRRGLSGRGRSRRSAGLPEGSTVSCMVTQIRASALPVEKLKPHVLRRHASENQARACVLTSSLSGALLHASQCVTDFTKENTSPLTQLFLLKLYPTDKLTQELNIGLHSGNKIQTLKPPHCPLRMKTTGLPLERRAWGELCVQT